MFQVKFSPQADNWQMNARFIFYSSVAIGPTIMNMSSAFMHPLIQQCHTQHELWRPWTSNRYCRVPWLMYSYDVSSIDDKTIFDKMMFNMWFILPRRKCLRWRGSVSSQSSNNVNELDWWTWERRDRVRDSYGTRSKSKGLLWILESFVVGPGFVHFTLT